MHPAMYARCSHRLYVASDGAMTREVGGPAWRWLVDAEAIGRVAEQATDAGAELIRFLYLDHGGVVRGKATSRSTLERRMASGIGLTVAMQAMSMLDELQPVDGMGPVGEVRIVPDPNSFVILPFAPGAAAMMSDLIGLDGRPWAACPRSFLRSAIEGAAADGLVFPDRCRVNPARAAVAASCLCDGLQLSSERTEEIRRPRALTAALACLGPGVRLAGDHARGERYRSLSQRRSDRVGLWHAVSPASCRSRRAPSPGTAWRGTHRSRRPAPPAARPAAR